MVFWLCINFLFGLFFFWWKLGCWNFFNVCVRVLICCWCFFSIVCCVCNMFVKGLELFIIVDVIFICLFLYGGLLLIYLSILSLNFWNGMVDCFIIIFFSFCCIILFLILFINFLVRLILVICIFLLIFLLMCFCICIKICE